MKFNEVGFRAYYHKFIVVPMKDKLRSVIENFPAADKANCILTYGYVDHSAGLTLEVLASAFKSDDGFLFEMGNPEINSKIRISLIMEDDCYYLKDENDQLYERYADKIDILAYYSSNDEIEKSRNMFFLDKYRSLEYPDDVLVYLLKDGNSPEGCWVRIETLSKHQIIGILLNEPYQDFGYHKGEEIAFYVHQKDDKEIVLCSY